MFIDYEDNVYGSTDGSVQLAKWFLDIVAVECDEDSSEEMSSEDEGLYTC